MATKETEMDDDIDNDEEQSLSQIGLIGAIFKYLGQCNIEFLNPRQTNAIIAAANSILFEMEKPTTLTSPGMGLDAWLKSDDTGMSSLFMAGFLGKFSRPYAFPQDADDFGRCQRLLIAVPEFADRSVLLRLASPQWARLVDRWPELSELMDQKKYDQVNAIIKECGKA